MFCKHLWWLQHLCPTACCVSVRIASVIPMLLIGSSCVPWMSCLFVELYYVLKFPGNIDIVVVTFLFSPECMHIVGSFFPPSILWIIWTDWATDFHNFLKFSIDSSASSLNYWGYPGTPQWSKMGWGSSLNICWPSQSEIIPYPHPKFNISENSVVFWLSCYGHHKSMEGR